MKNKVLIVVAALLLFIFLVFGTYAWYLFFLKIGNNSMANTLNSSLINGDITLIDNGNGVYDSDANSILDSNVSDIIPYKFKIVNKGISRDYNLYIEDLPVNAINDGCTENTLLERSQLKYELKLNGKVIKNDLLSNINDNILDKRKIDMNKTNNYELRIYIHDDAIDWTDKHYHYKIVLNKEN